MTSDHSVPMVEYTVRVLESFSTSNGELSLKEVSSLAQVTTSSTFRILFTLTKLGFLYKNPSGRKYHLGPKMMEIAWRPLAARKFVEIARPYLQRIHDRYNETVNLAILQDHAIVYVEVLESSRPFRMTAEPGARVPIHTTAMGKAIAAFIPDKELLPMLEECSWNRLTPRTIAKRRDFLKAIAQVREHGFSTDNEETELGASCLAVPVLNGEGVAVAAISFSAPTHRIKARQKTFIRELMKAAAEISNWLENK